MPNKELGGLPSLKLMFASIFGFLFFVGFITSEIMGEDSIKLRLSRDPEDCRLKILSFFNVQ